MAFKTKASSSISPVATFLAHDVGAVLADGRENVAGYPVLEALGLGFVRAHDRLYKPDSEIRLTERTPF